MYDLDITDEEIDEYIRNHKYIKNRKILFRLKQAEIRTAKV